MPLIMLFCIGCFYFYNRKRRGNDQARSDAKGHAFLAVFVCYPTICIVSFATFICKQVSP